MSGKNRRAHQRYPAWFPITFSLDKGGKAISGMLCDVSAGGALVWGFCDETPGDTATLDITAGPNTFQLSSTVVSVERQWDTVVLHLKFDEDVTRSSPKLFALLEELRSHFRSYQAYLAHRADDDPALGRTSTLYPPDRATA